MRRNVRIELTLLLLVLGAAIVDGREHRHRQYEHKEAHSPRGVTIPWL